MQKGVSHNLMRKKVSTTTYIPRPFKQTRKGSSNQPHNLFYPTEKLANPSHPTKQKKKKNIPIHVDMYKL
jgi:hypothetical protein